jgi:hypothetical protein
MPTDAEVQHHQIVVARFQKVLDWRDEEGWTFTRIGDELGVKRTRAFSLYQQAKLWQLENESHHANK